MKKWTHLYVFVVLSGLNTLMNLFSVFTAKYDEANFKEVLDIAEMQDFLSFTKASMAFQTNVVNKIIAVLLLLILLVVIFFLVKKRYEEATYTYMGYLFVTLIRSTYAFIGSKGLLHLYSDSQMRGFAEKSLLGGYAFGIVLFAIFFGLTTFFYLKKPKAIPEFPTSGMDL